MSAKVIQVIETNILTRGDGETTPVRRVKQYFSLEGELLAEVDPLPDHEQSIMVLTEAIQWALGEKGDFPARSSGTGAYWWRSELRKRAYGMLPKAEVKA